MYTRDTNLFDLMNEDIYKMLQFLDKYKFWEYLMEIIPGTLNWEMMRTFAGPYYSYVHVHVLEVVFKYMSRKESSGDWPTTLGTLLKLLSKEELYETMYPAVDYLANYLLKEASPPRLWIQPVAIIETSPMIEPDPKTVWTLLDIEEEPIYKSHDLERMLEEEKDNIISLDDRSFSIFR